MIIDLAKARDIALEVAENVRVPSLRFIRMAKDAGIKFTFGTNARNQNAGNFHYCIEMAEKAVLMQGDMFVVDTHKSDKPKSITYVTYENRHNPHVTIHCFGCNQIKKHGGVHKYGGAGYKQHTTYQNAVAYAERTKLPLKICSFCKPPDCDY